MTTRLDGLLQIDGHYKEDTATILTEHFTDSEFHENKKQRHQTIEERIAQKKKVLLEASAANLNDAEKKVRSIICLHTLTSYCSVDLNHLCRRMTF